MGALTNKNYPFELRSWEIQKIESVDFSDAFALKTKILFNNKILQIEPNHSQLFYKNTFINDKARYFFDNFTNSKIKLNFKYLNKVFKTLTKYLFILKLSFLKTKKISFFIIIYENINIDLLYLLSFFKKTFFFLKLFNINQKIFNNYEFKFLYNTIKITNSNLGILININSKNESTILNLILLQRKLKGNFKLFLLGSNVKKNLSFFNILGTSIKLIKTLAEGLHPICQNLKLKKNPFIILNNYILKINNNNFLFSILLTLYKFILFFNLNFLASSIYKTGINLFYNNNYDIINTKTLYQFSFIYFINTINNYSKLTKFFNKNLFYLIQNFESFKINKFCIIQNSYYNLKNFKNKIFNSTFYFPVKNIFEEKSFFINTRGLINKTNPILLKNNVKSHWKLLRNIFIKLSKFTLKNNILFFNFKNKFKFYKYIYLLYLAKKPKNKDTYNKLNPFIIISNTLNFKKVKILNYKIKYKINDFYISNTNKNSKIMIKLSAINRIQKTNFF